MGSQPHAMPRVKSRYCTARTLRLARPKKQFIIHDDQLVKKPSADYTCTERTRNLAQPRRNFSQTNHQETKPISKDYVCSDRLNRLAQPVRPVKKYSTTKTDDDKNKGETTPPSSEVSKRIIELSKPKTVKVCEEKEKKTISSEYTCSDRTMELAEPLRPVEKWSEQVKAKESKKQSKKRCEPSARILEMSKPNRKRDKYTTPQWVPQKTKLVSSKDYEENCPKRISDWFSVTDKAGRGRADPMKKRDKYNIPKRNDGFQPPARVEKKQISYYWSSRLLDLSQPAQDHSEKYWENQPQRKSPSKNYHCTERLLTIAEPVKMRRREKFKGDGDAFGGRQS